MQARAMPGLGEIAPGAEDAPALLDLGLLGGDESGAGALNAAGQVAGLATDANGNYRPCLWEGGVASDLGVLAGGRNGIGAGIDAHGRVVGWCHDDRLGDRAVLWWNGAAIELGGLVEGGECQAVAINAAGLLVGNARTARGERHACLWRANQLSDLGTLGGDRSAAYALNDAGLIVGMARDANGVEQAVTWREGGGPVALGAPLPGASRARGVNVAGAIVGSIAAGGTRRACRWEGSTCALLPLVPGWAGSEAIGINAAGQIVGSGWDALGGRRAVLWQADGPRDLNELVAAPGWVLESAGSIGDNGLIVGRARYRGQPRAFLLALHPAPWRQQAVARRSRGVRSILQP